MSRRSKIALQLVDSADVFAALGDATRLQIVAELSDKGPQSISRLTEVTTVTRQAVSKHLTVLADAGLVTSTRSGREQIIELAPRRLSEAKRCLDQISAQWDVAIDRLRKLVEG